MLLVVESDLSTKNTFLKQYISVETTGNKKRKHQLSRIATLCFNMFSDVSLTT